MVGEPSENQFLFLGDYVDRGNFSTECLILLLSLKIAFWKNVFLLRGNHETISMTMAYNFWTECLIKYNQLVYESFTEVFSSLPIAATINDHFICLHGGLSPKGQFIK